MTRTWKTECLEKRYPNAPNVQYFICGYYQEEKELYEAAAERWTNLKTRAIAGLSNAMEGYLLSSNDLDEGFHWLAISYCSYWNRNCTWCNFSEDCLFDSWFDIRNALDKTTPFVYMHNYQYYLDSVPLPRAWRLWEHRGLSKEQVDWVKEGF